MTEPFPGRKFTTPAGTPASMKIFIRIQLESKDVVAGFQTVVLPMSATDMFRFDAMAVKLNGDIVYTNPSSGLYSTLLS